MLEKNCFVVLLLLPCKYYVHVILNTCNVVICADCSSPVRKSPGCRSHGAAQELCLCSVGSSSRGVDPSPGHEGAVLWAPRGKRQTDCSGGGVVLMVKGKGGGCTGKQSVVCAHSKVLSWC